jgi:hypothetical protein
MAGYKAKGVAYAIAGILVVAAAVTYDAGQGPRASTPPLKTLAGHPWGVWLLALIGLGHRAFGIYCFAQARYPQSVSPLYSPRERVDRDLARGEESTMRRPDDRTS